jgi:hypothetical protein
MYENEYQVDESEVNVTRKVKKKGKAIPVPGHGGP